MHHIQLNYFPTINNQTLSRFNVDFNFEIYLSYTPGAQTINLLIKLMSCQKLFNKSFYKDQSQTIPADYIFDDVYKSASFKNKYGNNPKYTYYNALLGMKHKLSQNQSSVYDNLFTNKPKKGEVNAAPAHQVPHQKAVMPIYHVQKINKMKFKVYKHGVGRQYMQKLPVTDLSFQIKLKGDDDVPSTVKPRLEQILSEYRKMNLSGRNSRSKTYEKKNSNGSEFNVRLMTKTMSKFGRSTSTNKK